MLNKEHRIAVHAGLVAGILSSIVRLGVVAYKGAMSLDVVQTVGMVAFRGSVAGSFVSRCSTEADFLEIMIGLIISSLIGGVTAALLELFSIWVALQVAM